MNSSKWLRVFATLMLLGMEWTLYHNISSLDNEKARNLLVMFLAIFLIVIFIVGLWILWEPTGNKLKK